MSIGLPHQRERFYNAAAIDTLLDGLVEHGFAITEHFLDAELVDALREELFSLERNAALDNAGIGRGNEHQLRRDIRGDAIRWLDQESLAQRRYLAVMDDVREAINRGLYMGLFEFEAHFAHYPPGTFYKKHLDSFRGRANRVISSVLYLNRDWPADGGGEMALYASDDDSCELGRVIPEAGTFVCFLSDTIPHEVLPTRLPRASIAGWFRRNASLGGVVDPDH
ncbi:2OG-Fe(II) oxygenase [Phytohalomonas tamaricis]|uniref:2OG-Fe(II) oxygenase n=1 Tax=Phytohalomonas tamaricis TaxID=2081032 RepID=UPI000D0AC63A|nr:2OG-Fe(II) oxygenase [Phytohalomonas tamaricis]